MKTSTRLLLASQKSDFFFYPVPALPSTAFPKKQNKNLFYASIVYLPLTTVHTRIVACFRPSHLPPSFCSSLSSPSSYRAGALPKARAILGTIAIVTSIRTGSVNLVKIQAAAKLPAWGFF